MLGKLKAHFIPAQCTFYAVRKRPDFYTYDYSLWTNLHVCDMEEGINHWRLIYYVVRILSYLPNTLMSI